MAAGALAFGLGQGLLGAGQSVNFLAQQKQLALQNALREREFSLEQQRAHAQEAAQTTAQLPGGVNVPPNIYNQFFGNTPSAVRFEHEPAEAATPNLVTQGGIENGHPDRYTTNEPFNQWKAMYQGQTGMQKVGVQQAGALQRNQNTNATRQKIADGMQRIQAARNQIMAGHLKIGQQNANTALGRLQVAEQQLQLLAVQHQAQNSIQDYRAQTSPGAVNAQFLNNLGVADINMPSPYDSTALDSQVDKILAGLPQLGAAPGAAPSGAPTAPQKPSGKIMSITPIK